MNAANPNPHTPTLAEMMIDGRNFAHGAGNYREWAADRGYPFLEVLSPTARDGNCTFMVSKDGHAWFLMRQTRNGNGLWVDRVVDAQPVFHGTVEEALDNVSAAVA